MRGIHLIITMPVLSVLCFNAIFLRGVAAQGDRIIQFPPGEDKCGPNETFYECAPCAEWCDESVRTACDQKSCIPGCACKPGYFLTQFGRCVLEEECDLPGEPF